MTFDEFKVLVKGMKAVYTAPNFLPDADSVKIWFQLLQDLDYKVLSIAIQKYMMTSKFPPTIAELREAASDVKQGEIPDWGNGWEQVLKAIHHFGMYRIADAMQSFDPLTKQCVERLGFRNICLSENISQDRANFRIIYEQLRERKKKEAQVSLSVKAAALSIQEKNLLLKEGENESRTDT